MDAARSHTRHGDPSWRSVHHHGSPHGLGRPSCRVPTDGSLRVLPDRCGDRFRPRAADEPSGHAAAGSSADYERRDRVGRRRDGSPRDGPRIPKLVDGERPAYRRGPRPCAAAKCDHRAGCRVRHGGDGMDDRKSGDGRVRARRPSARTHPGAREAVPRHLLQRASRLVAARRSP